MAPPPKIPRRADVRAPARRHAAVVPILRPFAAAALVAALALPAGAGATPPVVLARAATAAEVYWGAVPCQGQLRIVRGRAVPAGLGPDTTAWVTFSSALGANRLAADPSTYTNCTIDFARTRWPTAASMAADWDLLCMTVTHEIGHLLGHRHDVAPTSIMQPVFFDYAAEPEVCRQGA